MKKIRPSSLNDYNACPLFSISKRDDQDPKNAYFGTMLHQSARGSGDDRFINYRAKEAFIAPKEKNMLMSLAIKVLLKAEELKDGAEVVLEEVTMQNYLNEYWYIEGTADLIIEKKGLHLYDWKSCKSTSEYEKGTMRLENMQHYVYSFMAMEIMGYDKCTFSYIACAKNMRNDVVVYTKEITLQEAKQVTLRVAKSYIEDEELNNFEAKVCSKCYYCPLIKSCSTYKNRERF